MVFHQQPSKSMAISPQTPPHARGLGGCAAALAATRMGKRVLLAEPADWVGGQLSQQDDSWSWSVGVEKAN